MKIPLGVVGQIVNSGKLGHRVRVEDDGDNRGGYLTYEWWAAPDGPNAGHPAPGIPTRTNYDYRADDEGWNTMPLPESGGESKGGSG